MLTSVSPVLIVAHREIVSFRYWNSFTAPCSTGRSPPVASSSPFTTRVSRRSKFCFSLFTKAVRYGSKMPEMRPRKQGSES